MTLSTFSRVTALLALVPSAVSWTLPLAPANVVPNYPVVPWKERGLYSGSAAKKVIERDGYSTGCNHGPAAGREITTLIPIWISSGPQLES
jgi:hypothetical protein